jgi:predicted ATPase
VIHLKNIKLKKDTANSSYPYHIPIFDQEITFNGPITIVIGDNGSGKSTLLEIIKEELGLFQIGKPLKPLQHVKCDVKFHLNKPKGFYFSSEDFTTYIYEIEKEIQTAHQYLKDIEQTYKNKSAFAKSQASSPHKRTLADLKALYDKDLRFASHGEAYLSFFKSRMKPNQLILLDEPETPLSFQNQLALIYLIHEAVNMNSQVIISTHSPVIMSIPNATIIHLSSEGLKKIDYSDVDQINELKHFLNHPEAYFKHLL